MRIRYIAPLVVASMATLLVTNVALAATITVTTTTDELNTDGDCSLREAIQAANTDAAVDACAAGSGADAIDVPAGTYVVSIAGGSEDANATGDWDIASNVTLVGAGVDATVLDGGGIDRALDLRCVPDPDPEGATCLGVTHIVVRGLTVRNGASASGRGGGIRNAGDGGSQATSPVTLLEDCRVTGSSAVDGGGVGNEGVLTIRRCTLENNTAGTYGGGFDAFGVTTIEDSSVRGNSSGLYGGGLSDNGSLVLRNSLVADNAATTGGAGLASLNSTVTAVNVTFTGNTITSNGGGAAIACGSGTVNPCTIRISHCTIAGNSAPMGSGGGIRLDVGTFSVRNSIVAGNTASANPDAMGGFTSGDYNILGIATGASGFTGANDFVGISAGLGALADNGGPTETRAIASTSPAIDAGTCTDFDGQTVSVDQRGVVRPQNIGCDIGAFEYVAPAQPRIDVLTEPAGANCAAGGLRIVSGTDSDRDGTLAGNEIASTTYVCDGAEGRSALLRLSVLAAGDANCPNGGTQIESGVDDGAGGATAGDGVLAASEVDATAYVCTGAAGPAGSGGCTVAAGDSGAGTFGILAATLIGLVVRRRSRRV